MIPFQVTTEHNPLIHVVAGLGEGFHRDPAQVSVVNATQEASGHPTLEAVTTELAAFHTALRAAGVTVHLPDLAPETVQDQTCPRDIGFVIGDTFVEATMTVDCRAQEIEGIRHILANCTGSTLQVPANIGLEGGDVIIDGTQVFVGHGQRSSSLGVEFLTQNFPNHQIIAIPCVHGSEQADILHLDCTFNPLGLGHALIYPKGMAQIPDTLERYDWIEVNDAEAYALATNVVSVAPDHIIARDHPACARVNGLLRSAGYRVTEVAFDAVPSIGGSFRCATLPLHRSKR